MPLVLVCFFFSGLTGLIYEILWTRMIVEIIGGAPFAVSIILTIFMGGLGLGSFLAGRRIDRVKEPLTLVKIYGILEIIIGLYALLIPFLLRALQPLCAILYNHLFDNPLLYNLSTFILCAIVLVVPVVCMGATLPLLCRFYISHLSHLGTHTGRLYGLNTIGAATGAVLCGFCMIQLMGIWGTLACAVAINTLIGISCLLMARSSNAERPPAQTQKKKKSKKQPKTNKHPDDILPGYPATVPAALVIFAISGFCAMAYEVIWTKLLGLIVGPTTYSFTTVLVTFIVGLALGSILFGKLADKVTNIIRLLVATQIIAALLALAVSHFMGNSQLLFAKVMYNLRDNFALLYTAKAAVLFAFMIPPTLCLGATFPLVGKIITRSITKVGRSLGYAYAINTIGAVLGSFCAGFVLIPLLGKENGLRLVIIMQLTVAVVVAVTAGRQKNRKIIYSFGYIAVLVLGILLSMQYPRWNKRILSISKYHRFEVFETQINNTGWWQAAIRGTDILDTTQKYEQIYYGDGIGGFTTVVKVPDQMGNYEMVMANSGKSDASARGNMHIQTLLAHFPMLFHPKPQKVMVLGLASGITAGEVLHYPIESLDVLDINRQVVQASKFFSAYNNNVLSDPRSNIIIQDGRAHLQLTEKKYDVIISEPSNPWMAGLATLFTRDFFEVVNDRLTPDGIFAQWLHSYEIDWEHFAVMGRTFTDVFPNSILISAQPNAPREYILLGFKAKQGLSIDNALHKIPVLTKSQNIKLSSPHLLYRHIVSEDLPKLFGPGPVDTDDRPLLEFAAPRLMFYTNFDEPDPDILENIDKNKWLKPATKEIIEKVSNNIDDQIDYMRYAFSVYRPFPRMVDLTKATTAQKKRYYDLVQEYFKANMCDYSLFADPELKQRCRDIQIKFLEDNIPRLPSRARSHFFLGFLYQENGRLDKAVTNYIRTIEIDPDIADAHNDLAAIYIGAGKLDDAVMHLQESLRINPNNPHALSNLAVIFINQNNLDEAAECLKKALHYRPQFAEACNNLGTVYLRQGKINMAIEQYTQALKIKPDFESARNNLNYARQQQ